MQRDAWADNFGTSSRSLPCCSARASPRSGWPTSLPGVAFAIEYKVGERANLRQNIDKRLTMVARSVGHELILRQLSFTYCDPCLGCGRHMIFEGADILTER